MNAVLRITKRKKRYPGLTFGSFIQILGLDGVSIGEGTLISDGAWLNICSPATGSTIGVGQCVQVGRYSMLNSGGILTLGDYCLLGPSVVISNSNHITDDVLLPYMDQGARLGGKTVIGDNCWIAANACVLGTLDIGRGSVVGAGSVVTRNVPSFAMVAGNPGKVVRLYNPFSRKWERAGTQDERNAILKARELAPLPDAETYRRQLAERSTTKALSPEFAGNGICY